MGQGLFLSTNLTLDLTIKNKDIDHGDFDKRYQMNRQRNQGKMVNELQRLRESR
jgi:predicted outer membrane protein